jgi:hypothetical protein
VTKCGTPAVGLAVFWMAWTTEQLRQIGQAIREDDQTFLTAIETALGWAFEMALSPQGG